jgi:hypothetical protein
LFDYNARGVELHSAGETIVNEKPNNERERLCEGR